MKTLLTSLIIAALTLPAAAQRGGKPIDGEKHIYKKVGDVELPLYVYTPEAASLIEQYLAAGNQPDAPGHFLSWLIKRKDVYARVAPEGTYDIGTIDAYRAVCRAFEDK